MNTNELSEIKVICTVCGGTGHIAIYNHVAGGECFTCNGTGHVTEAKANNKPVVIKKHTRTVTNGYFEFVFWSNGSVQVVFIDHNDECCAIRSVTLDEAREIWANPSLFLESF